MKCTHCSHENADDYHFCENCGERLGKECPECGHANDHDFSFCENCGHKFADEPEYVPASEKLEPEATPTIPTAKKKAPISTPVPVEVVPAEAAPAQQVVAAQQEKRGGLSGRLWPAVGLLAIIGFIIFGPRQPSNPSNTSSVGQSVSSGSGGSSGQSSGSSSNTSSGQSSSSSGDTSSSEQSGSKSGDTSSNEGNTSSSGQSNDASEGDSGALDPTFTADQETNCRYGPSASDFDVRRTIFDGQTVPIVGRGNTPAQEWWVVLVDGVQCWVWMDLGSANGAVQNVSRISPPATPTPEPIETSLPTFSDDACYSDDIWLDSIVVDEAARTVDIFYGSDGVFSWPYITLTTNRVEGWAYNACEILSSSSLVCTILDDSCQDDTCWYSGEVIPSNLNLWEEDVSSIECYFYWHEIEIP